MFHAEFYRARIVTPIADTTTWEVMYDDGEVDDMLCAECLRPFVPYEVGEEADWTDQTDDFVPCTVTGITGEDSYEVELEDGQKLSNVSAANLRRTLQRNTPRSMTKGDPVFQVGARVMAEFPGDAKGQFYPGVITSIKGNWYSIQYDDGDFSNRVSKDMIKA